MPSNLEFNLICDVDNHQTGRLVVQPFLADPELLVARCSVRLSHVKDNFLSQLAEKAVGAIAGRKRVVNDTPKSLHMSSSSAFDFLGLPTELRQHILVFTDLVTKWNEVEWNPLQGFYSRSRCATPGSLQNNPSRMHGIRNSIPGCHQPKEVACHSCWERSCSRGCFCKSYHSTSSNYHRCSCWSPPTSLFLVCKIIRQDALHIFFGRNRFVVAPEISDSQLSVVRSPPSRLPASIFLAETVPKDGLRHLRFLDIVIPPFGEEMPCFYCAEGSAEQLDWIQTLDRVKGQLNVPRLTIRLSFALWMPDKKITHYRRRMRNHQRLDILNCYQSILAPLKRLGKMKRLFIHMANPTATPANDREWYLPREEARAEKLIMGKDYNAVVAGKHLAPEGRWLEGHELGHDQNVPINWVAYVAELSPDEVTFAGGSI